MKVEREFVVSVAEQVALERADARLRRVGFVPDPTQAGLYHRGTLLASVFSSDPSALQTAVWVLASPNAGGGVRVRTSTSVNMTGQIATRLDVLFWKQELDALCAEIRTGTPQPRDDILARRASAAGALLVGASVLLTLPLALLALVVVGSPLAGALAYILSIPMVFVLGVLALRRGMPSLRSLSSVPFFEDEDPTGAADARVDRSEAAEAEVELDEDPNKLALDDFDRRLSEALGESPHGADGFGGGTLGGEALASAPPSEREIEQMAALAQAVGRQSKPR